MHADTATPTLIYATLEPGDPAPWFYQRSYSNPRYAFHTAAGRYVVLCFFASAGDPQGSAALEAVQANRQCFDDTRASFFGSALIRPTRRRDVCATAFRVFVFSGTSTAR